MKKLLILGVALLALSSCKKEFSISFERLPSAVFYYTTHNSIQQLSVDKSVDPVLFPSAPASGIWAIQSRSNEFFVSSNSGIHGFKKTGTRNTVLELTCHRFPSGASTDFATDGSTVYAVSNFAIRRFNFPSSDCASPAPTTTEILPGQISSPFSVEFYKDSLNNFLFVSGNGSSGVGVYRVNLDANNLTFMFPMNTQGGITITPSGNLYAADPGADCIYFLPNSQLTSSGASANTICDPVLQDSGSDSTRGPVSVAVRGGKAYVSVNEGTNIPGKIVVYDGADTFPTLATVPVWTDGLQGNRILIAN